MREQKRYDNKTGFLEASFQYLVRCGLENVSVRDLCKEIQISSGSLYYWFGGKKDICVEATVFGLKKVMDSLLGFVSDNIDNADKLFDSVLNEADKYKAELLLVCQVVASPIYGDDVRKKINELRCDYDRRIGEVLKNSGYIKDEMLPIVYILASVVFNYIVWGDMRMAKMQLECLYQLPSTPYSNILRIK